MATNAARMIRLELSSLVQLLLVLIFQNRVGNTVKWISEMMILGRCLQYDMSNVKSVADAHLKKEIVKLCACARKDLKPCSTLACAAL